MTATQVILHDTDAPVTEEDEQPRQETAAVISNYWDTIKADPGAVRDFVMLVIAILALRRDVG